MNRIKTPNLDLFKRIPVLITLVVVVVVAVAWYFGWWSRESSKLTSVNTQEAGLNTTYQSLNDQLIQINHDVAVIRKDRNFLANFAARVPPTAEQGQLTQDFYNVQQATNVTISSLDDATVIQPAPGTALGTVAVTLNVTGAHAAVIQFLKDLYTMPRLVTVQRVNPSEQAAKTGTANILVPDSTAFSIDIQATAYFLTSVTPATGSTTASS